MNKAIRGVIYIAGIQLEVFSVTDRYVFSQSQVASAINVNKSTISRWLATQESRFLKLQILDVNDIQTLSGKDYRSCAMTTVNDSIGRGGNNNKIKIVSVELASEFWLEQALKNKNEAAIALSYACLNEAIKRRCDKVFLGDKVIELIDYEHESELDRTNWLQSRSFLKDAHISFTNCCLYNGFNAAIAHNEITKQLLGKTASELREDELIDGNYQIGLNHISESEELIAVAKVKLAFSRYKVGNVHQRVKRAIAETGMLK